MHTEKVDVFQPFLLFFRYVYLGIFIVFFKNLIYNAKANFITESASNYMRNKEEKTMSQLFVTTVVFFSIAIIGCSLYCIYRNEKHLSYMIEIILLAMEIVLLKNEVLEEYTCASLVLVAFLVCKVIILITGVLVQIRGFYWARDIAQGNADKYYKKYNKKKFNKFVAQIRKISYGPRLKYGVPAMANRTDKKTRTKFDKRGFPIFNRIFCEVKLKRKDHNASREVHFNRASKALYEKAQKDKAFSRKFTKQELAKFKRGEVPSKYTWHHHQNRGKMQLVLYEIHSKVSHKGGFSIWGKKEK